MQHRDPPAYQEYASSIIAKSEFRELTLVERGLLYTLKLECWVNKTLPYDHKKLANYVGCDASEIAENMQNLMCFFAVKNGRLFSPELDGYRMHLDRVSEARRKGAIKTNAMKSTKTGAAQAKNERTLKSRSSEKRANAQITLSSLVQSSSVQFSSETLKPTSKKEYIPIEEYSYNPDEDEQL